MSKRRTEKRIPIYRDVLCDSCLGIGMILGTQPCRKCSGLGYHQVLVGERIEVIIEEEYSD